MRHKGIALLIALLAAGVLSGSPSAVTNPIIDWSSVEGFAYEPNFVMPHQSVAGNTLTLVGKVGTFGSPLDVLNDPTLPSVEYTFVISQLVSQGSVFNELGNYDTWSTNYSGGHFWIYKDTTPDRAYGTYPPNATAPSTFNDGELILEGTVHNFRTVSNAWIADMNKGGNYNADLLFTGGTQLPDLTPICEDINGFQGYLMGLWQRAVSATPAGYIRSIDGKIDMYICPPPAPTQDSTWGKIKSLY